ncbi:MAG: DEAD/DEAH box helicase [Betaproteobacteria bacterium]|nr:DEAD/DEAH box helicase [Betaproteobacteria bacterium]
MQQSFAGLGLSAELTRAVAEQGYTQPTPVQVQAIPVILEGRDVLAGAQTGTGKTAGFALPLLQRLASRANTSFSPARHPVRALILTPTRELAAQVEESVRIYGKYLPLRTTLVFGGVNINPQIQALRRGADILVATPGRLLDHVQQKTVDLSRVEILVLDEADRMLDMGFIHDIRRILALLPPQRQNLLFSATFSDEIRKLADGLLRAPALIEVARRNAESALVAQRAHPVAQARKRELLAHLVSSGDWRQVLVFTRTKHGANRLSEQLRRGGIESTAIHGNKSQPQRTKALADFKAGNVRVLVATDIAARGLDIEELPHVVNFDIPHVPEDYVHRIGRTGRAGSTGEAISLVSPEEYSLFAAIEKLLGRRLEREAIAGFEPGSAPAPASQSRAPGPQPAPRAGRGRDRRRKPNAAVAPRRHHGDPAREDQPASNAGQLFPSSGPAFGEPRPRTGHNRPRHGHDQRQAPQAALLGGGRRRTG